MTNEQKTEAPEHSDMVDVLMRALEGADRVVVETPNALGEMDAHYLHAPEVLSALNAYHDHHLAAIAARTEKMVDIVTNWLGLVGQLHSSSPLLNGLNALSTADEQDALQRYAEKYANAQVAAAYADAASYHDEIFKHDSEGIEYSSLVGIPISNLGELEQSCRRAEMDAKEIRSRTPEDAANALKAREDEAERRGMERAAEKLERSANTFEDEEGGMLVAAIYRQAAGEIRAEIERMKG